LKATKTISKNLITREFVEDVCADVKINLAPIYAKVAKEVSAEISRTCKDVEISSYPPGFIEAKISFCGESECSIWASTELEDLVKESDDMLYIEWAEELERVAGLARSWAKGKQQYRSDDDTRFIG
jgi:hypothetical protein